MAECPSSNAHVLWVFTDVDHNKPTYRCQLNKPEWQEGSDLLLCDFNSIFSTDTRLIIPYTALLHGRYSQFRIRNGGISMMVRNYKVHISLDFPIINDKRTWGMYNAFPKSICRPHKASSTLLSIHYRNFGCECNASFPMIVRQQSLVIISPKWQTECLLKMMQRLCMGHNVLVLISSFFFY